MRRLWIIGCLLLLSGCVDDPRPAEADERITTSQSSVSNLSLFQIPDPISIPSLSSMRLEGTNLTLESVESENAVYTRYAINYTSNGLKITGVLLIPKGEGPFPLVILNHGYIDPVVYTRGRGLRREQDYLAREGFAVLHTDYRGHAGSDPSPMTTKIYDGNLEYAMDSINAILAMRAAKSEFPTIDTEHVGMMGHSLGGGVTMAILTAHPHLVDAAVLYAPVSAWVFDNFTRWRSLREEGDNTRAIFGTPDTNPEIWNELSPASFVESIKAPILLVHGDRDSDVPKEWSDRWASTLVDAGKNVEYLELVGEGHEFAGQWTLFMKAVTRHLKTALSA
ncbi:MAG: alpha/beta fold hydrolase [Candidatus Peribacteraceae bacterium]